jgi:hypothetical protein
MKNPAHSAYSHITEQFRQPPSLPPKLAHPDCRLSERFNFHNIATKGGLRALVCALRRETRAGSVQSPAPSQACISSGRASRNCRRKADDMAASQAQDSIPPIRAQRFEHDSADRLIGLHFGGAEVSAPKIMAGVVAERAGIGSVRSGQPTAPQRAGLANLSENCRSLGP